MVRKVYSFEENLLEYRWAQPIARSGFSNPSVHTPPAAMSLNNVQRIKDQAKDYRVLGRLSLWRSR